MGVLDRLGRLLAEATKLAPESGLGAFLPPTAPMADSGVFAKALSMMMQRAPREEIWAETAARGQPYWQRLDGTFQMELPSDGLRWKPDDNHQLIRDLWNSRTLPSVGSAPSQGGIPLGEIVDNPVVYANYPELARAPVDLARGVDGAAFNNNFYNPAFRIGENTLAGVHPPPGTGGQESWYMMYDRPTNERALSMLGVHETDHALASQGRYRNVGSNPQASVHSPWARAMLKRRIDAAKKQLNERGWNPYIPPANLPEGELKFWWELNQKANPQFWPKDILNTAYRRDIGEANARLAQKRAGYSAAEIEARPPWLDYDVKENLLLDQGRRAPANIIRDLLRGGAASGGLLGALALAEQEAKERGMLQ